MAKTVDDSDGNFAWIGSTWLIDHKEDGSTPQYSNSPFVYSGYFMLVKWRGGDISIFGARRDNHGIYGVQIDGGQIQYYSGYSSTPQFQQVLYATSGLADGEHTVKVTNSNARNIAQYPNYIWLDIDHITFTGTLLNANDNAPQPPPPAPSTSSPPPSPTPTTSTQPSSSSPAPSSSSSTTPSVAPLPPPATLSTSTTISSSYSITSSSAITSRSTSGAGGSETVLGSFAQYPASSSGFGKSSAPSTKSNTSPGPVGPVNSADSANGDGKESNRTTVVAVSVTVIVIAAVVVATIGGLWYWRRKRRQKEEEEDDRDYLAPQSSWR